MARDDSVGLFWDDTPPPRPERAEKVKVQPPEPTWLRDEYLPGLDEALAFPVETMTGEELAQCATNNNWLIVDVEIYPNYFLACFLNTITKKVSLWEWVPALDDKAPLSALAWLMTNCTTIGFNSNSFDVPLINALCCGAELPWLKGMADRIILEDQRGDDILRDNRVPRFTKCDHFDLIEVAPLRASLKTYAGRLHAHKMQDLPFPPDTNLTLEQIAIVRWYCVNDCLNTLALLDCLREQIDLRYTMSNEYQVDLRSKSDAQIAEKVIGKELSRTLGRVKRPVIMEGTTYFYKPPASLKFQTPLLKDVLQVVSSTPLIVDHTGSIALPEAIGNLKLSIGNNIYRMGVGGLHSSEKCISRYSRDGYQLIDKDVTSYYPMIILNNGYAPKHLGAAFLRVYQGIVERRVAAKQAKQDIISQSLKIVVNGSFGKLGSKYSILYAPDLLFQVTLTGQLSLLMLIEAFELNGIEVISANTDGIVILPHESDLIRVNMITDAWERVTGFTTEETRYLSYHARDVNNYIAVKAGYDKEKNCWTDVPDGSKTKGAYANPWASTKNPEMKLHKNPVNTICIEAVENYLQTGKPVLDTIMGIEHRDIRKFVTVRTVKGGAVHINGDEPPAYVGKSVRWYYAKDNDAELVYALSGNRVPRSEGAKPVMVMPSDFPDDIDFQWYVTEAEKILADIGVC